MCSGTLRRCNAAPRRVRRHRGSDCKARGEQQRKRDRQSPPVSSPRPQTAGSLYQSEPLLPHDRNSSSDGHASERLGEGADEPPNHYGDSTRRASLVSPALHKHRGDRLQDDREVKRQRPALEVDEVEVHEVIEVEAPSDPRPATGRLCQGALGSACGASPPAARSRARGADADPRATSRRAAR